MKILMTVGCVVLLAACGRSTAGDPAAEPDAPPGGECTDDDGQSPHCSDDTCDHSTPEFCDGVDNDCDGRVDERWAAGSNACGFCDSTEHRDGEDNDCDGLIDEAHPPPPTRCEGADEDCDGSGDDDATED